MSDFKAKMQKIRFPLGLRPRPRWGAYSAPPDPLTVFKGPTTKGRASRRKRGRGVMERGRKREGMRRGSEGKKRWRGQPPNILAWNHPVRAAFVLTHSLTSKA